MVGDFNRVIGGGGTGGGTTPTTPTPTNTTTLTPATPPATPPVNPLIGALTKTSPLNQVLNASPTANQYLKNGGAGENLYPALPWHPSDGKNALQMGVSNTLIPAPVGPAPGQAISPQGQQNWAQWQNDMLQSTGDPAYLKATMNDPNMLYQFQQRGYGVNPTPPNKQQQFQQYQRQNPQPTPAPGGGWNHQGAWSPNRPATNGPSWMDFWQGQTMPATPDQHLEEQYPPWNTPPKVVPGQPQPPQGNVLLNALGQGA